MAAAADLKQYLLPFLGQPIDATLSTTDNFMAMTAANQALMELLGQGLTEEKTELVRAPVSVTLDNVTADSKAITFAGVDSWMIGCTIQIGSTWNKLVKPGATVSLEAPYDGITGTNVAATVYHDSITLDYTLDGILPPVRLNKQYDVEMMPNRALFVARQGTPPLPTMGLPAFALMEDALTYQGTPQTRFALGTLPLQKYHLNFTAQLRAPQITTWADPTPYFLPGGHDVHILYPVARFKLSDYPIFIGDRAEAEKAYGMALQKWAAYNNKGSQPGVLDIYG